MAKNRITEIWNQAIELNDAWREFASTRAQKEFANMPTGFDEMKNRLGTNPDIPKLFEAGQAFLTASAKRSKAIEQLKQLLLDELFNSNLLAVGYRQKPSESRGPVQIDPIFFEYPDIDWEGNCAEFNGKRFRAIRIFNPQILRGYQKLKTGRPSSGPVISAAIGQLVKINPDFCNLPRSIACEEIRKSIGKQSKPGNGLSDKNLEKYIIANCGVRRITK